MKKFYLLLTIIVVTIIQVANAQAPQGIPYQAVARDNAGNLIKNQPISLRFSIHDGSANGAVVYSETHAVTTDALGLFSVNIGEGITPTTNSTFANVNWGSGAKYTQVELDVAGGSNFVDMGTTKMMSVPYALYAGSSAAAPSVFEITQDNADHIHNTNQGNVGIGTDLPGEKLDVAGNLRVRQNAIVEGNNLVEGVSAANSFVKAGGTSSQYLMADGTTSTGPDLTGYATTASVADLANNVAMNYATNATVTDLANNVAMNYATNATVNDLANNVAMNYATNSSLNSLADNVAMNYASNVALASTNSQVQTNTTDIANLQTQIGNVQSNFVTTADNADHIHNTNSGNVGIGTDLPAQKLDVAGNVRVRGNVGIGTETPNTSAALEIKSNTGALLIPRMTTADRNNLNASEGMIIYNTSDSTYQGFSKKYTSYNTTIDQSQIAFDNGFGPNDKSQTFTAGLTGALSSVKVLLNCMMGPQSGTIFIRNGSGNSGTILYQTNIVINYNDGGNWVTINPLGVNIIAGNVYSINIVDAGGFDPDSRIDWFCRIDQDNYSGGQLYNGADPYGGDGVFQTTVTPSTTASLQWISLNAAQTVAPSITTTMGYIGSSSTIKGGVIDESGVLSLTPADAVNGGIVTTGNQNFAGNKSFNGNVGIGTNNPAALLNVVGGDRQSGIRVESYYNASLALASSTREYQIYSRQQGDLVFYDQTAEQEPNGGYPYRMIINPVGKVGIGNQSPTEQLDVTGNIKSNQSVMANSFVKAGGQANEYLMADGSTSIGPDLSSYATTAALDASNTQLTTQINDLNTVVSNTNTHLQNLAIINADQSSQISILNDGLSATNTQVQTNTTDITNLQAQIGNVQSNFVTTYDNPNNISNVNAGNVGIGTYLPAEKLDVNGNLKVRGNFTSGYNTTASGFSSTASGQNTTASGQNTAASGQNTTASGFSSTASGENTNASGYVSTARGYNTTASGNQSTASGYNSIASNYQSTASGYNTTASGWTSTASGSSTTASGDLSSASGYNTTAIGWSSTASGSSTTASGDLSTASGYETTANGYTAFSIGRGTTAGEQAFAGGYYTTASGQNSFAIGENTAASGNNSVALGKQTTAKSFAETAIGMNNTDYTPNLTNGWNSTNGFNATDRLFVIGNGTDQGNKSDAMVVLKNGNTTINGITTANSFVKAGGQANEYLMADGSVSTGGTGGAGVFVATTTNADNISNVNAGNVGIGTDEPSEKLDVAGNLKVRENMTLSGTLNNMNVGNLGTGSGNVVFGDYAFNTTASADDNTAIGNSAMENITSGNNNVAVGAYALRSNTTGFWNNAIGWGSLSNTTGSQNIGLGFGTLGTNTTGSQNTAIGSLADVATSDLNNATAIGNGAIVDASNKIQLGNTDVTDVNTSGTYTGAGFKTPNGTSSEYLMADGSVSTGGTGGAGVFVATTANADNISNVNAGNVGIGTDNPTTAKLVINTDYSGAQGLDLSTSNGYANVRVLQNSNSSLDHDIYLGFESGANSNLHLFSNDQETMVITNGEVHANGNTIINGMTMANSFVKAGGQANEYLMADGSVSTGAVGPQGPMGEPGMPGPEGPMGPQGPAGSDATSVFEITQDNADHIHNTNQGNVGIGTDLPSEKLDVNGNLKVNGNSTINGTTTANSFIKSGGTSSQYLMADGSTSAGTVATTMGTISASSTANGATITSGVLSLTPADGTNGGIITTGTQTIAGNKTFNSDLNVSGISIGLGNGAISSNTTVGNNALKVNSTGNKNVAVGQTALFSNTTGGSNTAIGHQALYNNITNSNNVAVGVNALLNNTANGNTATGVSSSQSNTTGTFNSATGVQTLWLSTTGSYNVAMGYKALSANTTGSNNVALGYNALLANTTGGNNVALGNGADVASAALTNATAIGNGAIVDASNKIQLGNTDVTTVNTSGTYTGAGFRATDSVTTKGLRATGTAGADSVSTRAFKATGNATVGGNLITFNPTNSAINATATASAANIISGYITSTSAAATTITLPTASAIATALGTVTRGTQLEFTVDNVSGAQTVTIALGTGITAITPVITGTNTLTVSVANGIGRFRLVFTSATAAKIIRVF